MVQRAVLAAVALAGCSSPARDGAAMVEIDGDWIQVTGNPDVGVFTTAYQQPVDFAIWQATDGSWHIWECIRMTQVGGRSRLFYHWQAVHVTGPWTPVGVAMVADPAAGETEGGLQAPYVFHDGTQYRMLYGTWTTICAQTSGDGVAFRRVLGADGLCASFSEGPTTNTRDPMVLRVADRWYAYYTAAPSDPDGVHGRVYARTSADLQTWSDSVVVSYGGIGGSEGTATECPFVVDRPDGYYLFRTRQYGAEPVTHVYRSPDPLMFGIDDDRYWLGTLPVAAPEFFEYRGQHYVAALTLNLDGIRIARLRWPDS